MLDCAHCSGWWAINHCDNTALLNCTNFSEIIWIISAIDCWDVSTFLHLLKTNKLQIIVTPRAQYQLEDSFRKAVPSLHDIFQREVRNAKKKFRKNSENFEINFRLFFSMTTTQFCKSCSPEGSSIVKSYLNTAESNCLPQINNTNWLKTVLNIFTWIWLTKYGSSFHEPQTNTLPIIFYI